jgi:hypothetical protein
MPRYFHCQVVVVPHCCFFFGGGGGVFNYALSTRNVMYSVGWSCNVTESVYCYTHPCLH